jgi:hypothetical protein
LIPSTANQNKTKSPSIESIKEIGKTSTLTLPSFESSDFFFLLLFFLSLRICSSDYVVSIKISGGKMSGMNIFKKWTCLVTMQNFMDLFLTES